MKILKYFSVIVLSMFFSACESNLEKVVFDHNVATPVSIKEIAPSYILDALKAEETVLTLSWTNPNMNLSNGSYVAVTNNIQMDIAGKDFANSTTLAATTGTTNTLNITNSELNNQILSLLNTYNMELQSIDVEIRIASTISEASVPVLSNVIKTNITPYSADIQYPEIYVIGDYSGWGWDNAQSLFSFKGDVNYEGLIDFNGKSANGFKITGETNWDNGNYGTSGAVDSEASEITLINDGTSGNISCYSKRFYHFSFSKETLILKKNYGFDVLSIVGNAGDEVYEWADPEKNGKEVDMNFDPEKQRFYADVEFADGEIKFRADHDWALSFGSSNEGLLDSGDNIKVTAGKYRVYVNLNNSNNKTYELNAADYQK